MGVNPAIDPRTYAFGVGRRICPGRDFIGASLFITASMLLATSTLTKAIDGCGKEIEPELITTGKFSKYDSNQTCSPVKCVIYQLPVVS